MIKIVSFDGARSSQKEIRSKMKVSILLWALPRLYDMLFFFLLKLQRWQLYNGVRWCSKSADAKIKELPPAIHSSFHSGISMTWRLIWKWNTERWSHPRGVPLALLSSFTLHSAARSSLLSLLLTLPIHPSDLWLQWKTRDPSWLLLVFLFFAFVSGDASLERLETKWINNFKVLIHTVTY